ncbi:MAG: DUF4442 domain-containing protein [Gemmatimonadota bacterium]
MPSPNEAPGARVLASWRRLGRWPGGRWLFDRLIARMVPYTGALRARVVALEPGGSEVVLDDRRSVRNHLGSVHAIALANLGELASGLAMLTALPAGTRGIVTRIEIDYLRKARGRLTARGSAGVVPRVDGTGQLFPEAVIEDSSGNVVARTRVTWKVEPVPARPDGQGD